MQNGDLNQNFGAVLLKNIVYDWGIGLRNKSPQTSNTYEIYSKIN